MCVLTELRIRVFDLFKKATTIFLNLEHLLKRTFDFNFQCWCCSRCLWSGFTCCDNLFLFIDFDLANATEFTQDLAAEELPLLPWNICKNLYQVLQEQEVVLSSHYPLTQVYYGRNQLAFKVKAEIICDSWLILQN